MLSQKEQENIVKRASRTFMNEWAVFQDEYDSYQQGYSWLMGDQYTDTQKSYYEAQRRPTNVWNLIFPTFNRILGDFLLNQSKLRIYHKRAGSPEIAGSIQDVLDDMLLNGNYKDESSATALAGLIKRGFTHVRFSDELMRDGSPLATNVDEFEILFDSRALDYLLDDAQYLIRSRWLTVDQIYALWPEHKTKLKRILKDREESAYWEAADDFTSRLMSHKEFSDERNGKYRIVEFHDREFGRDADVVYDPQTNDSEILTLEGRKRDLFLKANPQLRMVNTNSAEIITKTECIPGLNFFLGKEDNDIQDGHFDYVPFSAYSYGKKTINHFGLFKNAVGPQKDFNDTRNRMAEIINKSANAQNVLKPGKILNYRDIKKYGAEPGLNIEIKDEAELNDVYKRMDPPRNPFANQQMTESSQMLLDRIIGITENLKGMTQTSNENASLFAQRVQEASKAFATVDRNIKRTDCRVVNRMIKLMQHHYTSEKMFTVLNPATGNTKDVWLNQQIGDQIINDIRVGEYFTFPSTQESNPTTRAMKFMEKTELIKMVAELWGPMAVSARFWLEDAPIEKVQELIQSIEQAQMGMGIQAEQEQAMGQMQGILGAAQQRLAMEQSGAPSETTS